MSDLVDKLSAAIDEDERIATRAAGAHGGSAEWQFVPASDDAEPVVAIGDHLLHSDYHRAEHPLLPSEIQHVARHDPARVLRMVAAHRKILDVHRIETRHIEGWRAEYSCNRCDWTPEEHLWNDGQACEAIMALAEVYGIDVDVPR